jgi:hypothetical protein
MHPSCRQMLKLWVVVESMAGRLSALGQCISEGCVYTSTVRAQYSNGIFELGQNGFPREEKHAMSCRVRQALAMLASLFAVTYLLGSIGDDL